MSVIDRLRKAGQQPSAPAPAPVNPVAPTPMSPDAAAITEPVTPASDYPVLTRMPIQTLPELFGENYWPQGIREAKPEKLSRMREFYANPDLDTEMRDRYANNATAFQMDRARFYHAMAMIEKEKGVSITPQQLYLNDLYANNPSAFQGQMASVTAESEEKRLAKEEAEWQSRQGLANSWIKNFSNGIVTPAMGLLQGTLGLLADETGKIIGLADEDVVMKKVGDISTAMTFRVSERYTGEQLFSQIGDGNWSGSLSSLAGLSGVVVPSLAITAVGSRFGGARGAFLASTGQAYGALFKDVYDQTNDGKLAFATAAPLAAIIGQMDSWSFGKLGKLADEASSVGMFRTTVREGLEDLSKIDITTAAGRKLFSQSAVRVGENLTRTGYLRQIVYPTVTRMPFSMANEGLTEGLQSVVESVGKTLAGNITGNANLLRDANGQSRNFDDWDYWRDVFAAAALEGIGGIMGGGIAMTAHVGGKVVDTAKGNKAWYLFKQNSPGLTGEAAFYHIARAAATNNKSDNASIDKLVNQVAATGKNPQQVQTLRDNIAYIRQVAPQIFGGVTDAGAMYQVYHNHRAIERLIQAKEKLSQENPDHKQALILTASAIEGLSQHTAAIKAANSTVGFRIDNDFMSDFAALRHRNIVDDETMSYLENSWRKGTERYAAEVNKHRHSRGRSIQYDQKTIDAIKKANEELGTDWAESARDNNIDLAYHQLSDELTMDEIEALAANPTSLRNALYSHSGGGDVQVIAPDGTKVAVPVRLAAIIDATSEQVDGKMVNSLVDRVRKDKSERAKYIDKIRVRAYGTAERPIRNSAVPSDQAATSEIEALRKELTSDEVGYQDLRHAMNSVNKGRRDNGQAEITKPLMELTSDERAAFRAEALERSKVSNSAATNRAAKAEAKAKEVEAKPVQKPDEPVKAAFVERKEASPSADKPASKKPAKKPAKKATTTVAKKVVEKTKAKEKEPVVKEPKKETPKRKPQRRTVSEKTIEQGVEVERTQEIVPIPNITEQTVDEVATSTAQSTSTEGAMAPSMPDGNPDATVASTMTVIPMASSLDEVSDTDAFSVQRDGGLTIDQEEMAMRDQMAQQLSKAFGLDATATDSLIDEFGYGVVGRATRAGVEYARNSKAENVPHEFSHFYWRSHAKSNSSLYNLAKGQAFVSPLAERLRAIPQYANLTPEQMTEEVLATVTGQQFVEIWGDWFKANGWMEKALALGRAFWNSVATIFSRTDVDWTVTLAANIAAGQMATSTKVQLADGTIDSFSDPSHSISVVEASLRQGILNNITSALIEMNVLNGDSHMVHFPHAVAYHRIMQMAKRAKTEDEKKLRTLFGGEQKYKERIDLLEKLYERIQSSDADARMDATRQFNDAIAQLMTTSVIDPEIADLPSFVHKVLSSTKGLPMRDLSFVAEEVGDAGNSPTFKALVSSLFDVNGRAFKPESVIAAISELALKSTDAADFRKKMADAVKDKDSQRTVHGRIFNQMHQRLSQIAKDMRKSDPNGNNLNAIYNEFRSTLVERVVTPTVVMRNDGTGLITLDKANITPSVESLILGTLSDLKGRSAIWNIPETINQAIQDTDKYQGSQEEQAMKLLSRGINVIFGEKVNVKDRNMMIRVMESLAGTDRSQWYEVTKGMMWQLANRQKGMKFTAVAKPFIEKVATSVFLFQELETSYVDHNGQKQQATTIANWAAAKSANLFSVNKGNKQENIAIMLGTEFYGDNEMLRLWQKHRSSGRTIMKGMRHGETGIDLRDMSVRGLLFSDMISFLDGADDTYLQNNGELGTREYKEMYLAQKYTTQQAVARQEKMGPVMAERANMLLNEGRVSLSDLARLNMMSAFKLKTSNGKFVYDAEATNDAITKDINDMVEQLSAMNEDRLLNRMLMTWFMGMDISGEDLGPLQTIAWQLSKMPDMAQRFAQIEHLNADRSLTTALAKQFVNNYVVNQQMLTDITMGNVYQYKELGDYRKREMNQGSKGHEIGLDSQIHVLRMPDIIGPDGKEVTNSFNVYDHNLNQAIIDAGGSVRASGNNHKMSMYHVDKQGYTYNVKSAALGVTLDGNDQPSLAGYDHLDDNGNQTSGYQNLVKIIEAYRQTLPENQRANAKIMLAFESSVKNWGPGQVLPNDVYEKAQNGTLSPNDLTGKGNTIKPLSFRQNFNINKQYANRQISKKLPVQAVPMLFSMLKDLDPAQRQSMANDLVVSLTELLEFQKTLLDEKYENDAALATELMGKAIMNNRTFANESVLEHMLEILDKVKSTGVLSIEDDTILTAALGKLTDIYNRAAFHPMLNGADLQMMPDISGDLKWGDVPEVIVPSYMGNVGDTIVLMRVPLSAPGSMFHAKIKGHSPSQTNTVIVPHQYASVSNADYDADKLFTFFKKSQTTLDQNKQEVDAVTFYGQQIRDLQASAVGSAIDAELMARAQKKFDEALLVKHQNQVVDAMLRIMANPKAMALRDQPLDTNELRAALANQGQQFEPEPLGLPMANYRNREQTLDGAGAIGVFATAQKTGSMLAQSGVRLSVDQAPNLTINKNKYQFVRFGFGGQHLTGQVLQVALDRVKEQLMMPLGINTAVMSEMAMLMQLETADGKSITADDLVALFTSREMRTYAEMVQSHAGTLGSIRRMSVREKLEILNMLKEQTTDADSKQAYDGLISITNLTNLFNHARRFVQLDDGIPYGMENLKAIEYDERAVIADSARNDFGIVKLLDNPLIQHRINSTRQFQERIGHLSWRLHETMIREGGDLMRTRSGWYDQVSRQIFNRRYSNRGAEKKLLDIADRMLSAEHLVYQYVDQQKVIKIFSETLHNYVNGADQWSGVRVAMMNELKEEFDMLPSRQYDALVAKQEAGLATPDEILLINRQRALMMANENAKENLFLQNLIVTGDDPSNVPVRVRIYGGLDNTSPDVINALREGFDEMPQAFQSMMHDYLLLTGQTRGALWEIVGGQTIMERYDDTIELSQKLSEKTSQGGESYDVSQMHDRFVATAVVNMFRDAARMPTWTMNPRTSVKHGDVNNINVSRNHGLSELSLHAFYPNGIDGVIAALASEPLRNMSGNIVAGKIGARVRSYENVYMMADNSPINGELFREESNGRTRYWVIDQITPVTHDRANVTMIDVTTILEQHENVILALRQDPSVTKPTMNKTVLRDMLDEARDVAVNSRVIGNLQQGTPLIGDQSVSNVFKENKELYDYMIERLTKAFKGKIQIMPWDEYQEAYGQQSDKLGQARVDKARAVSRVVSWSMAGGRLDVAPHEFAHHYVDMMRNTKMIKEALKQYGGDEEALVDAIGRSYVEIAKESLKKKSLWAKFYRALASVFQDRPLTERIAETIFSGDFLVEEDAKAVDNSWDLTVGHGYGKKPLTRSGTMVLDKTMIQQALGSYGNISQEQVTTLADGANMVKDIFRQRAMFNMVNVDGVFQHQPSRHIADLSDDIHFLSGIPNVPFAIKAAYDALYGRLIGPRIDAMQKDSVMENDMYYEAVKEIMSGLGKTHEMTDLERMAFFSIIYNPNVTDNKMIPVMPSHNVLPFDSTGQLTNEAVKAIYNAKQRYNVLVDLMTMSKHVERTKHKVIINNENTTYYSVFHVSDGVRSLNDYIRSKASTIKKLMLTKIDNILGGFLTTIDDVKDTRSTLLYRLFGGENNVLYQTLGESTDLSAALAANFRVGVGSDKGVTSLMAELNAEFRDLRWRQRDAPNGKRELMPVGFDMALEPSDGNGGYKNPVTFRFSIGEVIDLIRTRDMGVRRGTVQPGAQMFDKDIELPDGLKYRLTPQHVAALEIQLNNWASANNINLGRVNTLMDQIIERGREHASPIMEMVNGIGVHRQTNYWFTKIANDKGPVMPKATSWANPARLMPTVGIWDSSKHIRVEDAFDMIDEYVTDVTEFIRTAMPVMNTKKILRYGENVDEPETSTTIQDVMVEERIIESRDQTYGPYYQLTESWRFISDIGVPGQDYFARVIPALNWLRRNVTASLLRMNPIAMAKQYLSLLSASRHINPAYIMRAFVEQKALVNVMLGQMNVDQLREWARRNPVTNGPMFSVEASRWRPYLEMMEHSSRLRERFQDPQVEWYRVGGQSDVAVRNEKTGLRSTLASLKGLLPGANKPDWGTNMHEALGMYLYHDMINTGLLWEASKKSADKLGLTGDAYWQHVARLTERATADSQPGRDRLRTSKLQAHPLGFILMFLQSSAQRVSDSMVQPIYHFAHNPSWTTGAKAAYGIGAFVSAGAIGSMIGYIGKDIYDRLAAWLHDWFYDAVGIDHEGALANPKYDHSESGDESIRQEFYKSMFISSLGGGMPIMNPVMNLYAQSKYQQFMQGEVNMRNMEFTDMPGGDAPIGAINSIMKFEEEGFHGVVKEFVMRDVHHVLGMPSTPIMIGYDALERKYNKAE